MSDRSTLVLLHSLGQDGRAWDLFRAGLPSGLRVEAPNLADISPVLDFDVLVDALATSVEGMFDVVGVAFGGIVAQHVMTRMRGRVRSAVLVNTPARMRPRADLEATIAEARRDGTEALVSASLERWFTSPAIEANFPGVEYVRRRLSQISLEEYFAYWRSMGTHDLVDELDGLETPTTLVIARSDRVASRAIHELRDLLPNSILRYVDGSHMVHLESSAALARVVIDHLDLVEHDVSAFVESGQDRLRRG